MKLLQINDLSTDPPGGWRWTCPKNQMTFTATNFIELMNKVRAYRKANKLWIPNHFVAWLENDLCQQGKWGPETCHEIDMPFD